MPVDRTLAEGLASTLVDLYSDAQTRLAADLARRLADGIGAPDWVDAKLAEIGQVQNFAQRVVHKLRDDMTGQVQQDIEAAYNRGGQAALDELARQAGATADERRQVGQALPGTEAIQRLVLSLVSKLEGTHVRILRWDLDAYRDVIARTVATGVLMGTETRLKSAQRAWSDLVGQGITGFVDKSGRRWQLTSYVEMATRTGTAQAAVQGHLDRLGDRGFDLVIVSDAPQECERCRPWEGQILDRNGAGGPRTVQLEHATIDGRMVNVDVAGSVVEAVAAGFMHPNCRHSLSAYVPGLTTIPKNTADPEGDKNRQQLRALERDLRAAKLDQAAAMDPAAAKAAGAKVRALQADIRDHVAASPGLLRQTHREQIGAGNMPPDARGARSRPRKPKPAEPKPEPTPEPPRAEQHVEQPTGPKQDYSTLTDDELDAAFQAAAESGDDADLDAILAQMDRRQAHAEAVERAAAEDQAAADEAAARRAAAEAEAAEAPPADDPDMSPEEIAQWERFDELLAAGESEEEAAAQVFGRDVDQQKRDRAIAQLRAQGYVGRGFDELARKSFRDHIYQRYMDAEDACRGHLLTPAAQAAGIDPHELFTGPQARARKWASDELKEWWDQNGRITYDEWVAALLGERPGYTGSSGDSFLK
jgi:hypothetical protein